ncbi:MAG TPA: glutathione S-transferase family protein [Polyangiaceae bacterium]|nr:glutathione S-transferase family protein [Polyangiaceae bacterium]
MRLYFHPMSSNSRRARMAALQLGISLDLVPVDLAKGQQKSPEFLRMNPNGRVPVLDDDGFFLNESHAIMQYLAEHTPGQTLYPTAPQARADVNRWLFWSAQHLQPAVSVLNWERVIKPFLGRGDADPKEVARGEQLVTECARVLDAHLAGKQWVAQGALTLADLALAATLMVSERARLPIADCTNLHAWFARVRELDAWKKTEL